jgi:glutamate racemase
MSHHLELPIGVFDSGVGGLTVLQALHHVLPQESYLYLGDTARVPYGSKAPETILRYVKQAVEALMQRGIKLLVIACNTATAVCLPHLRKEFPQLPIIGVIEPGAMAAVHASYTGHIAVIATETTVNSGGYQQAIQQLKPDAKVHAYSGALLVSLAEEGWTEGPITEAIIQRYLEPVLYGPHSSAVDCLVLGCTHYPTLLPAIRKIVGNRMSIVDSAKTTAEMTARLIFEKNLMTQLTNSSSTHFLVTDVPERFSRVAGRFLGWNIPNSMLELVNLSDGQ